jgi:TonB family protein
METLASAESAPPETEPELHLLLERDPRDDWHRWRSAAVVSAAVHAVLLIVLLLMPESAIEERVYPNAPVVKLTPLYIPTDLTQRAPNKGKISKELTVAAIPEHPVIKSPSPAPAARPLPATKPEPPSAPLPPQVAKNEPKPVIVEPPKIELPGSQAETQGDQLTKLSQIPPPPPPPQQPKLTLENVNPPPQGSPNQGKPLRGLLVPNPSVESAVRELTKNGGAAGGRQSVGDLGLDTGVGMGINLPPSAGQPHSNLELRSDPQGVDFRPYMQQVLAAVRRNWFAVYPEAARLGQRGEVVLEFGIARGGVVTKVIFSSESGAKALDQSAVAAISASNPLPPLPTDFKGDRIVLRMTFMYNIRR